MELFIGIDQSINSTGVTVQEYNYSELIFEHFFIITGKDKLTKKEQNAQDTYSNFDYVLYEKKNTKLAKDTHEAEEFKTTNLINISSVIISILKKEYYKCIDLSKDVNVYICMEGISYQSGNTSSLMDLAGLNYLIRYRVLKWLEKRNQSLIGINTNYKLIVSPPAEIKKYATGNGASKKEAMITLFEAIYPNMYLIPKIDDIADSYWMCQYAKHIYKTKT